MSLIINFPELNQKIKSKICLKEHIGKEKINGKPQIPVGIREIPDFHPALISRIGFKEKLNYLGR